MASRSRVSSRLLGVISVLGVSSGCAGEDVCDGVSFDPPPEPEPSVGDPPTLVEGEWLSSSVLELRFSSPLSSNGDLDPRRFEILSWDAIGNTAYERDGASCSLSTTYRAAGSPTYYYYYSTTRSVTAAWIGPEDPTLLRVQVNSAQCRIATGSLASGLMLTYTDSESEIVDGGELLDADGDPMAAIGAPWASVRLDGCLDSGYCFMTYDATGHLPALDSLAPIPCP